jgi:hypothetical protein
MTLKRDEYGNQIQAMHPYLSQAIGVSIVSAPSAAFTYVGEPIPPPRGESGAVILKPQRTMHIRVVATVACWITFGPSLNPDGTAAAAPVAVRATAGSMFIPAGVPEYFWVRPRERLAVVSDATSGGSLYITELANN